MVVTRVYTQYKIKLGCSRTRIERRGRNQERWIGPTKFPKKLDIQQRIKGWIGGCIHRQACKRGNTRPIISVENNSNKAGMGKGTYFLILLLDIIPRPRRSFPPRPGAGTETKPNYSSVSYYQLPPRHSMSDKTFSPVLRRPFPPPSSPFIRYSARLPGVTSRERIREAGQRATLLTL